MFEAPFPIPHPLGAADCEETWAPNHSAMSQLVAAGAFWHVAVFTVNEMVITVSLSPAYEPLTIAGDVALPMSPLYIVKNCGLATLSVGVLESSGI